MIIMDTVFPLPSAQWGDRQVIKFMRNGTKLKQLLYICDLAIAMDNDGLIVLTTINKSTYGHRRAEGATFSAALDKAYRQMLRDAKDSVAAEE